MKIFKLLVIIIFFLLWQTDNNSVVQTAAKEIQRLQGYKDELERKKFVLEENVEVIEGRKHYLRVPNHATSGIISSMIETLKLLKNHGVETTSIKSNFSQQELFASLEIETEVCLCLKPTFFIVVMVVL
jgi:hypothetical protein